MDEQTPAVIVNIQRQPGANIISVVDRIKNCCRSSPPPCQAPFTFAILTDRTTTIRASVSDVQFELMLTIALVVMVIFLFLRNLCGHHHPQRGRSAFAGRNVRRDVSARIQPE